MKNSLRLKILETLVERLDGKCSNSFRTCPREIEQELNLCKNHSHINEYDELIENFNGDFCDCQWFHMDCTLLLLEIGYRFHEDMICPCGSNLEFEDILRVLLKEINRLKENGNEQER